MEFSVHDLATFGAGVAITIFGYQVRVFSQMAAMKLKLKAVAKGTETNSVAHEELVEAHQELVARVEVIEKANKIEPKAAPALTVVQGGKAKTG